MNDTKWDEVRLTMYSLGDTHPAWRTKDVESGFVSSWDGEWFHHFRQGGYKTIAWVEIQILSPMQDASVLTALKRIHVPGEKTTDGYRILGYVESGQQVHYIE